MLSFLLIDSGRFFLTHNSQCRLTLVQWRPAYLLSSSLLNGRIPRKSRALLPYDAPLASWCSLWLFSTLLAASLGQLALCWMFGALLVKRCTPDQTTPLPPVVRHPPRRLKPSQSPDVPQSVLALLAARCFLPIRVRKLGRSSADCMASPCHLGRSFPPNHP